MRETLKLCSTRVQLFSWHECGSREFQLCGLLLASLHMSNRTEPNQHNLRSHQPTIPSAPDSQFQSLDALGPVWILEWRISSQEIRPTCRFPRGTISWSGFLVQMTYSATHPRTNPCLDATTAGHKLVTSTVQVIEDEITAGADGVHTGRGSGVYMSAARSGC